MLKLKNREISPSTLAHLEGKQLSINQQVSFAQKIEMAGSFWDGKSDSRTGKEAFREIKARLTELCVGVGLCNYCEQNEASDIEHILPKSVFPERTFQWENYVLACKLCNTGFKLDKMYVFPDSQSLEVVLPERGEEPPSQDYAFIHIRDDDPEALLELSFDDFQFYPKFSRGTRAFEKARRTEEILELSSRPTLVWYRSQAFEYYSRLLEQYVQVKEANSFQALRDALPLDISFVEAALLDQEKDRILGSIRQKILKYGHPTVWREMMRQQAKWPNIQRLIEKAKETLSRWMMA